MRTISLITAVFVAFAAGCGGGDGGTVSGKDGGATPDEVFQTVKSAMQKKDYGAMYLMVDPEQRDIALAGMIMVSGFLAMGKDEAAAKKIGEEVEAILKKHGVDKSQKIEMGNDEAKMKEAAANMFAKVKNKAALFHELLVFVEKNSDKKEEEIPADAVLKDVKEDGDKATGTVESKGKKDTIEFIKRNGKWYMGKM